jgi:hypothetical protein
MANSLTLQIGVDTTALTAKLTQAEADVRAYAAEVRQLADQLRTAGSDATLRAQLERVSAQLATAQSAAASFRSELGGHKAEVEGLGAKLGELKDIAGEVAGAFCVSFGIEQIAEGLSRLAEMGERFENSAAAICAKAGDYAKLAGALFSWSAAMLRPQRARSSWSSATSARRWPTPTRQRMTPSPISASAPRSSLPGSRTRSRSSTCWRTAISAILYRKRAASTCPHAPAEGMHAAIPRIGRLDRAAWRAENHRTRARRKTRSGRSPGGKCPGGCVRRSSLSARRAACGGTSSLARDMA